MIDALGIEDERRQRAVGVLTRTFPPGEQGLARIAGDRLDRSDQRRPRRAAIDGLLCFTYRLHPQPCSARLVADRKSPTAYRDVRPVCPDGFTNAPGSRDDDGAWLSGMGTQQGGERVVGQRKAFKPPRRAQKVAA